MKLILVRISLPYATFGLELSDKDQPVVVTSAPIGQWMVGKPWVRVREWIKGKGGTIEIYP